MSPGSPRRATNASALVVMALLAACVRHAGAPSARTGARTDASTDARTDRVVLISIDTLRADHVGARREGVALTPTLDALAEEAISFDDAVANSTITRPGHASMLTGLYPWRHGISANTDGLAEGVVTLGERLQGRGIDTAAVVSSTPMRALWRGFSTFRQPLDSPDRYEAPPEAATRAARDWLVLHRSERFFLFVHYFPPHGPYVAPASFRLPHEPLAGRRLPVSPSIGEPGTIPANQQLGDERDVGIYRARYAANVRYVDSQVGALLDTLRALGMYDRAAVIVTSDHGESLGEHGLYFTHGRTVYREQSAVPLLVKLPGGQGGGTRSRTPVEGVDLFPTVLELLGQPVPADVDGRSLLRAIAADAPPKRLRFTESADATLVAVLAPPWKLTVHSGPRHDLASDRPRMELYRLDRDPGETSDLASQQPLLARQLLDETRRRFQPSPAAPAPSPENERELRALGYVQ